MILMNYTNLAFVVIHFLEDLTNWHPLNRSDVLKALLPISLSSLRRFLHTVRHDYKP
jgi:hypothetical protein